MEELHVDTKTFYALLHHDFGLYRNDNLEGLFRQIKVFITKKITLSLPELKSPQFINDDTSRIGNGCVLL